MAEVPTGQSIEPIVPRVESIAPNPPLSTSQLPISATDATLAAELANKPNSSEIFDKTMNLGQSIASGARGEVGDFNEAESSVNKTLSATSN
jgi:hypothetical protein